MLLPLEKFIKTDGHREIVKLVEPIAQSISKTAAKYDRSGEFPFEHYDQLTEANYHTLTLPKEEGGKGVSLYEFLLGQEIIASGDASTALGIGWHLGMFLELSETRKWDEKIFHKLCQDVIHNKALFNRAATEPTSGSPTRGAKMQTTATKADDGSWTINGKKTFTSVAPRLDYIIVNATIEETGEVGGFLVPKEAEGLTIEYTWDTLGMRGTGSEDIVLDNVHLPEDALLDVSTKSKGKPKPTGWLLHIPACYLGVALAARHDVIDFAKNYIPGSLNKPISEVPHVREKIGDIDLELMKAHYLLYGVAEQWDHGTEEERANLGAELGAAKYVTTNAAVKIVDLAMRIVGGTSIFRSKPFERYYRDVRAGIHNPPSDDIVVQILAGRALK